jgi:hypothetical protein
MPSMTRAHLRANWSGVPSLTELWLGALLRAFAMLVSFAANLLRMRPSRLSRECHADVTPAMLPEPESGIIMETKEAAGRSQPIEALMLSSASSARPSKQEGGLPYALRHDACSAAAADDSPRVPAGRAINGAPDRGSNRAPDRTTTTIPSGISSPTRIPGCGPTSRTPD